jgi:hypothetical protein
VDTQATHVCSRDRRSSKSYAHMQKEVLKKLCTFAAEIGGPRCSSFATRPLRSVCFVFITHGQVHIHTFTHTTWSSAHTHGQVHIHTYTHTTWSSAHTHGQVHIHTYTHTHIHTYTHTHIHTHTTWSSAHTHGQVHIHTYINTLHTQEHRRLRITHTHISLDLRAHRRLRYTHALTYH